jgi:predicted nucleotidyltransferase
VEEGLTREQIVERLHRGLEVDPSVYAMWIEGSLARGDVDDMSDVDLVADVEDGSQDRVFHRAEALLAELGPLVISLELDIGHQFLRHRLYRLGRTSEFWTIDFVLQAHSREFVFDREDEGVVRLLFDKAGVVRFRDHPWRPEGVEARLAELADTYRALRPWVVKQVRRGKFVEAFGYYERYVLQPLVEALRLAYAPRKSDHYVKDIYRDLPAEVTAELERLYRVPDLEAFRSKLERADLLFQSAVDRLSGSSGQAE